MKINCIIVDDAPLAIDKLKSFVAKLPNLNLLQSLMNGMDAVGFIKSNPVDLIFLDIQMDGFTGLQLLDSMKTKPYVIITSAYNEYAVKGYDYEVTDYLLKPFSFERFVQAVDKVSSQFEKQIVPYDYMFVKTEYRIERVDFKDILYIEGMKEYLQIVTTNSKIMTLQSFAGMEKALPKKDFIRIHRSFIVALNKIDSIERNIVKIGNKRIPIGLNYKDSILTILK